ncbi:hypothetical protein AGMMS49975_01440 [Clostridia bacterium]|nr:hypothetical protein AGMMS49975_01440 [Clostridia bacterium]
MANELGASLDILFGKMESFIGTKTVVGDPITIGGIILVPLVEVSFGVGAGAYNTSEPEKKAPKDAGAGGLGARISPYAVITIIDGVVQLINIKNQDSVNKLIDMAPGVLSKLNLSSLFGKGKKDAEKEEGETAE